MNPCFSYQAFPPSFECAFGFFTNPEKSSSALLLDVSSTESQLDANKGNAIFGLTTLSNFLLSGDLKTDLCLGRQEHCDKNDLKRAIVAKVKFDLGSCGKDQHEGDDEGEDEAGFLKAKTDAITIGSIAYIASGSSEEVLSRLGAIAGVGIKNVTVSLGMTPEYVQLSARGQLTVSAGHELPGHLAMLPRACGRSFCGNSNGSPVLGEHGPNV